MPACESPLGINLGSTPFETGITKRVNELMFRFAAVKRLNHETLLLLGWLTLVCRRGYAVFF